LQSLAKICKNSVTNFKPKISHKFYSLTALQIFVCRDLLSYL
jgi:hypothetical protein